MMMRFALQNLAGTQAFVTCQSCGGPVILSSNGRPRVHPFCNAPPCRKAAAAARMRASRAGKRLPPITPPAVAHVETVVHGSNADLIRRVARKYLASGATVADVTYGHGVFWRQLGRSRFHLIGSDIRPMPGSSLVADFRHLPYADRSIDVAAFDPPYVHTGPNGFWSDEWYGNHITASHSHADIMQLYRQGMTEALRILKPGGTLWVKCKDEIESGQQRRSHIEIYQIATEELGMRDRDKFVLVPPASSPARRWHRQQHAHKNHSYLWVFERRR
jgi:hypothetical protein